MPPPNPALVDPQPPHPPGKNPALRLYRNPRTGKAYWMLPALAEGDGIWLGSPGDALTDEDFEWCMSHLPGAHLFAREAVRLVVEQRAAQQNQHTPLDAETTKVG